MQEVGATPDADDLKEGTPLLKDDTELSTAGNTETGDIVGEQVRGGSGVGVRPTVSSKDANGETEVGAGRCTSMTSTVSSASGRDRVPAEGTTVECVGRELALVRRDVSIEGTHFSDKQGRQALEVFGGLGENCRARGAKGRKRGTHLSDCHIPASAMDHFVTR